MRAQDAEPVRREPLSATASAVENRLEAAAERSDEVFEKARLDPAQEFVHDQQRLEFVPAEPQPRKLEPSPVSVVAVASAGPIHDRRTEMVAEHGDGAEQRRAGTLEFRRQLVDRNGVPARFQHPVQRNDSFHAIQSFPQGSRRFAARLPGRLRRQRVRRPAYPVGVRFRAG